MKVLAKSCHGQLTLLPAPPECGQAELRDSPSFSLCHAWDGFKARENRWDRATLRTELRV